MSTIAVLGAGELGGAIAQALAERSRVSRVLLIDSHGRVAAGKALDIQQAGAISASSTRLEGTTDPSRVAGSSVCVVADRAGEPAGEWRLEDGLETVRRFARDGGTAPLVFAGTNPESLMRMLAREAGVERHRLIGSAPGAVASAVRAMVAIEAGCSVTEVSLSVLGRPPRSIVVPWVEGSVAGYSLEKVLSQAQVARVEARLARLWPPGPHTLGRAAADVVEALVHSARRPRCVTAVLDGEFGARGQTGAIPAYLGPSGIERTAVPALNTRERVQVEAALEA
jgi:malate/lactate dehydrogenase